jgi:hypothetical protein
MPRKACPDTQKKGRAAITPDQLRGAARNLSYALGIPVYIRDGRIYQEGPGLAFLPPNGDPAVAEVPLAHEAEAANGALTIPKAIGLLLITTHTLWLSWQMLT